MAVWGRKTRSERLRERFLGPWSPARLRGSRNQTLSQHYSLERISDGMTFAAEARLSISFDS